MMCFEGIPSLMTSPVRLGGLRRHYALKHKLVLGGGVRERILRELWVIRGHYRRLEAVIRRLGCHNGCDNPLSQLSVARGGSRSLAA